MKRSEAAFGRPFYFLVLLALAAGAHADPDAGQKKAAACVTCHGPDGNSASGEYPILAGQTARYVYLQLKDFKEGRRSNGLMAPFVAKLSRDDMLDLADYFAAQKPKPIAFKPDPKRVARGKKKADEVLCTMCHLGGMKGQNEIPRVAGQYPEYVIKQLKAFKARTRTNDAGSMTSVSQTISERDIEDLAHYIANLD
ncbi:MAG TPA: c-type cytochrome [Burkholderiales bacterium]|nr:c-type cytochrome [Burkholderiales bacterium]